MSSLEAAAPRPSTCSSVGAEEVHDEYHPLDIDASHYLPNGIFSIESLRFPHLFLGKIREHDRAAVLSLIHYSTLNLSSDAYHTSTKTGRGDIRLSLAEDSSRMSIGDNHGSTWG